MPATQPTPSRHRLITALAGCALLLLASCATQESASTGPASEQRAERLLRQGNASAAAQMFVRLAGENPPPQSIDYSLAAARAWLAANRPDDAQHALEAITATPTAAQKFELDLQQATVAMARGQYLPAWRQISAVAEPRDPTAADRLLLLQQRVALHAGQPVEAVRAGVARERVASNDNSRQQARRQLLTDLRAAIDRGLKIDLNSAREPLLRGWLEVAQIAASAGRSPLSADASIERWRTRFPGHPAATIVASEIQNPGARPTATGSTAVANTAPVGLLLPLTGRQSMPAALIRDGFLAAIARLPEAARPTVRVYDTGTLTVGTAIANAQAEGAGFLVGPLTREEVQTAVEQRPGNLPLLLLNSVAGGGYAGSQVYQYGLAPEDEARQIARQVFASGQRRAAVLAPAGDWGNRVAAAFTDELTRAGGAVVNQATYDLSRNDLTAAVTRTLGVDEARARYRRVQSITGTELVFDVHPRPDIQAIFAAGYQPLALRQINPQLRFFNAGALPVYITQDGLDATIAANRDLEGMRLVDMPWALETAGPVADTRSATEAQWLARGARASRYFAFGYDAATLTLALRNAQNTWPLAGLTGRLSLAPEGRIERSLDWARMREGSPRLSDPINP